MKQTKLTKEQIIKIRELAQSNWSQRKLAQLFGVSKTLIQKILSGEDWNHV